jgi:hypothetical protein
MFKIGVIYESPIQTEVYGICSVASITVFEIVNETCSCASPLERNIYSPLGKSNIVSVVVGRIHNIFTSL